LNRFLNVFGIRILTSVSFRIPYDIDGVQLIDA
jgi:hypothetical protein